MARMSNLNSVLRFDTKKLKRYKKTFTLWCFFVHVWPKENQLSCLFMKKENEFSCHFGYNITSNGLYQAIRNNFDQKDN